MHLAVVSSLLGQAEELTREERQWLAWCGGSPQTQEGADSLCLAVARVTGNEWAATFAPPLVRMALVILLAIVAQLLLRRAINRFVRRTKTRGLDKIEALSEAEAPRDVDIARATMRAETIAGVLRSLAAFSIWIVAVLMILGELDLSLGPLIAGAGIAGVAIGFGAQTLVRDFLSGIFMLVEDQYGLGDIINTGEASGVVEAISLRTTRIRDVNGVVWHIPNGEIRRIGNMSQQWSRALLDIGVAYDTNLDRASEVIKRVADEFAADEEWRPQVVEEPELWGVEAFGNDEITMRLVVKTKPQQQWKVARQLRRRLKDAFDEAGIEIPFPQRTLWLRTPVELTASKQKGNGEDTPEA